MDIELSSKEATFLRHAISVALNESPAIWDSEQIHVLNTISKRVWEAHSEEMGHDDESDDVSPEQIADAQAAIAAAIAQANKVVRLITEAEAEEAQQ
jgi:hypothetical protein